MDEPRLWRSEERGPEIDDHILEQLRARLAAAAEVDARRLEVDVRDREVILAGTTRDERMTRAICPHHRRACRAPVRHVLRPPAPVACFWLPAARMNMNRTLSAIGFLVAAPHLTLAQAPPPTHQEIVGSGHLEAVVRVRDVRVADHEIGGTIANLTDDELRDVQLRVRDMFLWRNERRPGDDDFSRAEEFVVRGPIPPRGALAFTAPRSPLAVRIDGEYRTTVEVTALTRQPVTAQAPAMPSPAAAGEPR